MTTWTFPRHREYERALREVAAAWFASKGFAVSKRYGYILANRDEWVSEFEAKYGLDREVVSWESVANFINYVSD